METWQILLDIFGVAVPALIFWIRSLQTKIDGLTGSINRLVEQNEREHAEVHNSVVELKENLTQEVRDINKAHSLHDQAMAVQGRVLEEILVHTRGKEDV